MRSRIKAAGWATLALSVTLAGALPAQRSPQIRTFPAATGSRVEVSVNSGEIRVTSWETPEIQVLVVGGDPDHFQITQSGSTVRVQEDRRYWEDARLEIRVPRKADLDLRTRSGEIEVRGKIIGNVSAHTSAGDVVLGDIEGRVFAGTSGGDVEMGRLKGDGDLKTSGGDIETRHVEGSLDVKTSGGRIRTGDVSNDLQAKTSGGDIDAGQVGGSADLNTSGGDVSVRSVGGRASLRSSGGDIELDGRTGPVSARTSGGDIELRLAEAPLDVRTSGGDIEIGVEVGADASGESRVVTKGGEIVLMLTQQSRATIEAHIRVKGGWERNKDDYQMRSDFEAVSMQRDAYSKEIRGRFEINGGGHLIVLETSNGDITIRRSSR